MITFSTGNFVDGKYDGDIHFSVYDHGLNTEDDTYFRYLKYEYDVTYHEGTGEYLHTAEEVNPNDHSGDYIVAENLPWKNQDGREGNEGLTVKKKEREMINAGVSDWD